MKPADHADQPLTVADIERLKAENPAPNCASYTIVVERDPLRPYCREPKTCNGSCRRDPACNS